MPTRSGPGARRAVGLVWFIWRAIGSPVGAAFSLGASCVFLSAWVVAPLIQRVCFAHAQAFPAAADWASTAAMQVAAVLAGLWSVARLACVLEPRWAPPPRRVVRWQSSPVPHSDAGAAVQSLLGQYLSGDAAWVGAAVDEHAFAVTLVRRGVARLAPAMTDAGLVLMAAAVLVQARAGWAGQVTKAAAGETVVARAPDDLRLRLEEVRPTAGIERLAGPYGCRVTPEVRGTLRPTIALHAWSAVSLEGYRAFLVGVSPAVRIRATGRNGEPLLLLPLDNSPGGRDVRVRFGGDVAELQVAVPDAGVVLRAVAAGKGPARRYAVQALSGEDGRVLDSIFITDVSRLMLTAADVTLAPETDARIRFERRPGDPLAAAGIVLWLLGMPLARRWPRKQLWVIFSEGEGSTWMQWAGDGQPPVWWPPNL